MSLVRFPVHKSTCPASHCQAILTDGIGDSDKRAFHGHGRGESFYGTAAIIDGRLLGATDGPALE